MIKNLQCFCSSILFTIFLSITLSAPAQDIKVEKFSKDNTTGYKVLLLDEQGKADDFLPIYFKNDGRVRNRWGMNEISALTRADFNHPEITLTYEIDEVDEMSRVLFLVSDTVENSIVIDLEKMTYNFGVDFYRFLAQEDIDESLQALAYTERQHQRLLKDSVNLQRNLKDNQDEKVELEEALELNGLNYQVLLQKIENNSQSQDSLLMVMEKIRRLIEVQKKKKEEIK